MKGGRGEEKDLIPRKCSTNLPARCRKKTLACPLVSFPPASVSVAAPRPEFFHLTSIIRMCQSTTLQAGRLGQPLVRHLVASLHLSRFQKRGKGKSGRGGWRIRTPTWWGGGERGEEAAREGRGRAGAAATPRGAASERPRAGAAAAGGSRAGRVSPGAPARESEGACARSSRPPGSSRQCPWSGLRCAPGPAAERPPPPAAAAGGRT